MNNDNITVRRTIPFMPTIIEHAASLIGQTPSDAAQDASLMARAHIEAYKLYRPDAVTVGMDIYNIEAEALGCRIRFYEDASIPGILTHPLTLDCDFGSIAFSTKLGRIQILLDAAKAVKDAIGHEVRVNIGICGPFSILMELLGFETAIHAFVDGDERVLPLLAALLEFQKDYCNAIVSHGLGVVVFESWASPPLISPDVYRTYALPYEQALLAHLKALGIPFRPLIIGGDTRPILDDILESSTTLLVSDYNTPLPYYIEKARSKGLSLRANIDPKLISRGVFDEIEIRVKEIAGQWGRYPKLIAGTGVVPYDTPPENLLRVKEMLADYSPSFIA